MSTPARQWAHALKTAGLNVEALDGWQMRAASSYSFEPVGIMLHHTASNAQSGNMPCRNLIINGRRDLKGPLSQFLVGRNGDILLVAGKRCNHAGRGMAGRIEQLLADVEPPDYGQGLYDAPKPGRIAQEINTSSGLNAKQTEWGNAGRIN